MNTKIFVMTHKKFVPPADPMYVPLQVGRAENGDLGEGWLGDDQGDHISDLNHLWGELTGLYWIWRNYDGPEAYVGINHYRRYFLNEEGDFLSEDDVNRIMTEYDMIASERVASGKSYRDVYEEAHNIKDLFAVGDSIAKLYPDYKKDFDEALAMDAVYSANLMVARRKDYDAYCAWLFDVLSDAAEKVDVTGYDLYHARVFGFLSEGLLTVWARHHQMKVYEARIGYTDEKAETKELRLAVGTLLQQGQFEQAETMFNEIMTLRPDISLPMSDIRKEIPVIQQILYIGNQENKRGLKGLFSETTDLTELLKLYDLYYRSLQAISEADPSETADDKVRTLKEHHFTEVTLEVMLHYDMYKKYGKKPLDAEKVRRALTQ